MKPLRWVAAVLVWIAAGLLAALGVLLSATIVLLPLGIPVLLLARRLFALFARLMLPPAVVHPVQELQKRGRTALAAPARYRHPSQWQRVLRRLGRVRRCFRAA